LVHTKPGDLILMGFSFLFFLFLFFKNSYNFFLFLLGNENTDLEFCQPQSNDSNLDQSRMCGIVFDTPQALSNGQYSIPFFTCYVDTFHLFVPSESKQNVYYYYYLFFK